MPSLSLSDYSQVNFVCIALIETSIQRPLHSMTFIKMLSSSHSSVNNEMPYKHHLHSEAITNFSIDVHETEPPRLII